MDSQYLYKKESKPTKGLALDIKAEDTIQASASFVGSIKLATEKIQEFEAELVDLVERFRQDADPLEEGGIRNLAEDLKPLVIYTDILIDKYQVDFVNDCLNNMRASTSKLEALPFPETMKKAEIQGLMNNFLAKILDLMAARTEQLEAIRNNPLTPGNAILKAMGII